MGERNRAYRIGEIAQQAGVTVESVRYYERLGLLPKAARTEGGARRYGGEVGDRIGLIKQLQALDLTLSEVRDLLGDSAGRTRAKCRRVHDLVKRHIEDVDRRVSELLVLRQSLDRYRRGCEAALGREPDPDCPAVDTLERLRT